MFYLFKSIAPTVSGFISFGSYTTLTGAGSLSLAPFYMDKLINNAVKINPLITPITDIYYSLFFFTFGLNDIETGFEKLSYAAINPFTLF